MDQATATFILNSKQKCCKTKYAVRRISEQPKQKTLKKISKAMMNENETQEDLWLEDMQQQTSQIIWRTTKFGDINFLNQSKLLIFHPMTPDKRIK